MLLNKLILLFLFVFMKQLLCQVQNLSYRLKVMQNNSNTVPVILVPGILGSQLYAKLEGVAGQQHRFCSNETKNFYRVWFSGEIIIPKVVSCMLSDIRLVYNETTRRTSNLPGVDVKVPGEFGDVYAVEYLGSKLLLKTAYFHNMISYAVDHGYERNLSIFGAGYDWRKAPNEQDEYFQNLKNLIEKTVNTSGKRAVLLCHSMGCLFTLYFLNQQPPSWKSKHVLSLITIGGPWGGAVGSIEAFAIGHDYGLKFFEANAFLELERTMPSIAFLMPTRNIWRKENIFVETPLKNYTTSDYENLFQAYGDVGFYNMWKDTSSLVSNLTHPGVDIFCIHGSKRKTVEKLVYTNMKNFPKKPHKIDGDGDGTVNLRSLSACLQWANNPSFDFQYYVSENGQHVKMIQDSDVIELVFNYIEKLERKANSNRKAYLKK